MRLASEIRYSFKGQARRFDSLSGRGSYLLIRPRYGKNTSIPCGVARDHDKAAEYLQLAAQQGDIEAQRALDLIRHGPPAAAHARARRRMKRAAEIAQTLIS